MAAADIPSKLGEFLLRGWVLTDNPCPVPSCGGVPLLRSPKGQGSVVHHCVSCDGAPLLPGIAGVQSQSSSTVSSTSYGSRPSTPPTEISSNLSSPTFAPPVETEETRRRRQQSDQASTEIGKRLLKGWAMLGEECPNPRCYGIPLVGPPKKNGDKDPRKECVVCRTVYVTEGSSEGWQHLVPISSASVLQEPVSALTPNGLSDNGPTQAVARNGLQPIQLPTLDPVPQNKLAVGIRVTPEPRDSRLVTPAPAHDVAANASAQALELALGILSERLSLACANPRLLDPSSVAETADAIGKVAQALTQVNYLRQHAAMESSSIS